MPLSGLFQFGAPAQAEMRVEWRSVLSGAHAQRLIAKLRETSPALVLSGGGGKGAYEIGCIRALHKCGIRNFTAIAGTSVGALNASLVAQGDLRTLIRIWRGIRFRDVLKAHPVGFLVAAVLRLFLAPMFVLRSVPSFWEAAHAYGSYRKVGFDPIIALAEGMTRFIRGFMPVFLPIVACLALVFSLGAHYIPIIGTLRLRLLEFGLMPLGGLLLLVLGLSILMWWGQFRVHNKIAARFALFSNEPLQNLIRKHLDPAKIRMAPFPTYVTLASLKWLVEPPRRSRKWGLVHSFMNYRLRFVPIYRDLRELSDEGMREHVVQSASLPEVFPLKVASGVPVVDGGVVDNTPIVPVRHTDSLIIIYLQAGKRAEERLKDEIVRAFESEILQPNSRAGPDLRLVWPWFGEILGTEKNTTHSPSDMKGSVLMIVPSRGLGGLFTGTMNFTAHKARRLMWLGYWDTLQAIKRGLMAWPGTGAVLGKVADTRNEAVELSRAAAKGNAKAQCDLGYLNRSVLEDHVEAFRWFLKAAEQGYSPAQRSVAFSFLGGLGTPVNAPEGFKWLRSAAEQGEIPAQFELGMYYKNGVKNLVPQDYLQAVRWLTKSALRGHPVALAELAHLSEIGAGVPRDLVYAYELYSVAKEALEIAIESKAFSEKYISKDEFTRNVDERIRTIRQSMTAEQIAEAERRALGRRSGSPC